VTVYQAVRADGRVITTVIAGTPEAAIQEITKALRGRPGGRHELYCKWVADGQRLETA